MTFRAKPVVKRPHSQWDSPERRNFLTNLAFGLVVIAAILILVIAAVVAWYDAHLAPVGRVDGEAITKDEHNDRVAIEDWRLLERLRRLSTQAAAGRVSEEDAASEREFIEGQRSSIADIALERIIDNRIQAGLAVEEGVAATPADVDARLIEEATIPETRHAWAIEVDPAISEGAVESTPEQIAEARDKAAGALADLKAGKPWEDVAKTVSTDATTRDQGGDLGWVEKDTIGLDEALLGALFELEAETASEVIEGADGIFRIGRVTEIEAEKVDELYQTKLVNDGIDIAKYRAVVEGDVIRTKLEEKIVADVIKPGAQRRVQEIFIADPQEEVPADAVKVRHILYSPNDTVPDPASPLPSDDPGWAEAEADARSAYERLQEDPTQFDRIARTESDESVALGTTGRGGKLGLYIAPTEDRLVKEFVDAVSAPGLEDGQVLEPVRTTFGWHVIQIQYRPPDMAQMEKIKQLADAGEDFAQLARDFSESTTGGAGGELGWIARGQLDDGMTVAIFGAPIGKTSEIVQIEGEGQDAGLYLFKVLEEETRTPEGRQLEELRSTAFSDWYTDKKGNRRIERLLEASI